MDYTEQNVRKLVEEVIKSMNLTSTNVNNEKKLGVFSNLNNAVEASDIAFKEFSKISLEIRKKLIANIRKISMEYNEILSKMAHEETGMGRWENKVLKNELGINKTPGVEDIVSEAFTDDHGLTLVERAPYGVIGAITPSTNPVVTIICNAIGMLAAGNAVVFNPHPSAKKVSASTVSLLCYY